MPRLVSLERCPVEVYSNWTSDEAAKERQSRAFSGIS